MVLFNGPVNFPSNGQNLSHVTVNALISFGIRFTKANDICNACYEVRHIG